MKTLGVTDRFSTDAVKEFQEELLLETVSYANERSPFYKRLFDNSGLSPSDLKKKKYFNKLPFTTKPDIQKSNRGFLAVPKHKIAEVVSTTGTTGEPVFISLTENDLERLAYNEEKSFSYTGAGRGDLFQIAVTCDNLFIAGIAYYKGLLRLGASVVRVGPQNIIRHFDIIKKLNPTGIIAVPSFMFQMVRRANEKGISVKDLGIEKIVLIGDSIRNEDFSSNALGQAIEDSFGKKCYSTYGITEGQVSFCECEHHSGLHSHPDLVFAEIVDENGNSLPDFEIGELVITPFQIEGMPLIRYKTGDITFKITGPCSCGRTSVRIGPILGRKFQRLKVKGVTLYPKTIENAILELKDVINYQIEAYTGTDQTDHLILRVGSYRNDPAFRASVEDILRAKARVAPEIEIESPEEIEKRLFSGGSRKAVTFKCRRTKLYE